MARKENELFVGNDYLTIEGASIKHPALFSYYANLNVNKITADKMKFIGLDLETNHKTSELKLLGFVDEDNKYEYYTANFLGILFDKIRNAYWDDIRLVCWNKLDHFVLFKQFLPFLTEEEINKSLNRFGKISGEWDNKEGEWITPPVVEIQIGNFRFGIVQVIRSSIQFFFYNEFKNDLNKVWMYDIATLYLNDLKTEASRLSYYSKVDESAHKVDWIKFENDKHYREDIVLKSNYLDCRAVKDLAILSMDNFYKVFNWYPRTLISAGSLARAGIVATIKNKYPNDDEKFLDELNSIPLINYKDNWIQQIGENNYKDLLAIFNESYSGGYIESPAYGSFIEGFMADIASAYPSIAVNLWDLRGSKLTIGKGTPPEIPNSYCFIRGDIIMPEDVDYHPITIKHDILKDTNIRAVGEFRASYTLEERNYCLSLGAKFEKEEWFNIKTSGKLSPLAEAVRFFLETRTKLIALKDSAEYTAKTCANSIYGILYEAIKTYLLEQEDVIRSGYRAGEFNNSLYATIITSGVRILISKGANAIKKAGGQPSVIMTDSIFWKGTADMLPKELWREKKTLGYFEKPEKINNMICLGAGRYEYYISNGNKYKGKKRGLNITDLAKGNNDDGIVVEQFNWRKFLEEAIKQDSTLVKVKVRVLVSVGLVSNQSKYSWKQLGLIIDEEREVELIVGYSKRLIPDFRIKDLKNGLIVSKPLLISYQDSTYPKLRELMAKKKVLTTEMKIKENSKKSSKNYYKNNKKEIKEQRRNNYQKWRNKGKTREEARALTNTKIE